MHPELFTLYFGNKEIVFLSYSFFYVVAIIFMLAGGYVALFKKGNSHKKIIFMIGSMGIAGLLGARFLHAAFNVSVYTSGQLHLFDLHMSGFTIVGGLIFAIITGWFVGKQCDVNVWQFGDIIVPFVAFSIAIARIGCFLNGCCFGHVTHMPWGVKFPLLSFAHQYQITHGIGNILSVSRVHPTQLYEMAAAVIGGMLVLVINHKKVFDGAGILFFGMWFSAFRLINMFFRQMPESLILSQNRYITIYFCIFIACFIIFLYQWKRQKIKNIV